MQQALSLRPTDTVKAPLSSKKKFMIGGVAALSAAAIAVTPVTADPSVVSAEYRAVQLAAYTPNPLVTDTPAEVYGGLFNLTASNISAVSAAFSANPFPLASQIAENQQGYLKRLTDVLETYPAGVQAAFSDTGNVGRHITAMQEAIAAGEIFTAYQEYNAAALYASLAIVAPFTNLLLSRTPRGSTTPVPGIPEEVAQNFADAVGVLFSSTALQSGIFYASFALLSGTVYEAARVADVVYKAVQAGDFETVGIALVNTPGVLANAFLNGFDYSDADSIVAWPGLLAPLGDPNPRTGAPLHPGGLIYQALVGLPTSIAKAIDNTPDVPATTRLVVEEKAEIKAIEQPAPSVDVTAGDDVKELTVSTVVDKEEEVVSSDIAETTDTEPASKLSQRTAKVKADAAKAGERINAAVKQAGDSLKKRTTKSDSDKSASTSGSTE